MRGQGDLLIGRKCIRVFRRFREFIILQFRLGGFDSGIGHPWNYILIAFMKIYDEGHSEILGTRVAFRFFFFLLHHLFYINSEIKFIYAPLRNINNQSCASSRIYGKFTEYVKKDIKKTQRKILDSKGRGQIFVIRKQKYKLSRIFIGIKCFPRH